MTKMRDAIIFVGFWRPPPSPDAKIINYLNNRERRAPSSFVGFWRPPMTPSPPPQTSQYLTTLLTERGGAPRVLPFVGFLRPPMPPPSPPPTPQCLTILMTEREGGAIIFCTILAPPPSPDATILNNFNNREKGAPISCKKLNIHV